MLEPLTCVKLHVSNVKKELCHSPSPPPPTDVPQMSANEGIKYTHSYDIDLSG